MLAQKCGVYETVSRPVYDRCSLCVCLYVSTRTHITHIHANVRFVTPAAVDLQTIKKKRKKITMAVV
jgi:hypothetical protein